MLDRVGPDRSSKNPVRSGPVHGSTAHGPPICALKSVVLLPHERHSAFVPTRRAVVFVVLPELRDQGRALLDDLAGRLPADLVGRLSDGFMRLPPLPESATEVRARIAAGTLGDDALPPLCRVGGSQWVLLCSTSSPASTNVPGAPLASARALIRPLHF